MAGGIERTMVFGSVLACALSGAVAAAPRFAVNVLSNSLAEDGAASPNWAGVPIPGWTTTAGFTVIAYGSLNGAPTLASPGPPDRGANLFCGGSAAAISTASQTIDVSALASAIDSGLISCQVSGWLGGLALEEDVMILNVVFRDSGGASLFSANIVGPTSFERGGLTALLWRQTSQVLPLGTRSVGINLLAQRVTGTVNNAYADSLGVVLSHPCPADMDDGTAQGVPDGGVDVNDLLYFLPHYEAATPVADIDDGNGLGVPDGGVDINDLLFFLLHYEEGC